VESIKHIKNNNMENVDAVEEVVVSEVSVYEAQDKAMIDMQIATAKRYPRNVQRAIQNSMAIITLDVETAKTCHYSVPRGGKSVSGPSVHLAKILAQNWGNMRIEAKVVATDDKHVTSQAVAFDLETNLAIKVEVKRSIVGKFARYNDDMITVTGNAGNSIALRNAVLAVIPKGVVDKCYNTAKAMITGDVSDETKLIARRKQVVDGLKDTYGVAEKDILAAIGKQAINHITADDIIVLIGIGQAIKDGDTTVEEAFKGGRPPAEAVTFESVDLLFQSKKGALTPDELKNAERILNNKEEKSYSKLLKLLQSK